MKIKDKNYNIADFISIPLKNSPVFTMLQMAGRAIEALIPYFSIIVTAKFVDTAIGIFNEKADADPIYLPLILLMGIIAYQNVVDTLMGFAKIKLLMRLNEEFRVATVEKRAKLEYRHIENNETWDLVARVCLDPAERIYGGFNHILDMASLVIQVASIIVLLVLQIWWAALLVIAFSAPLFIISIKSGKKEYTAYQESEKFKRKAGYLESLIIGRENVEERTLFSYTEDINKKWYEKYEIARKIELKTMRKSFVKMRCASIFTIFIALIISGVMIPSLSIGTISIGMYMGLVIATFNLVGKMTWNLSYITEELARNIEYLKDLSKFSELSESEEILGLPDGEIQKSEIQSIEFANVSFRYPETENYILKGLSFKLDAKMHYAFVGVNGAGKTTLIKILTGLYDNFEGEIFINDKSIREYTASELKGLFSVAYQDFAKYYISLKDNVALGNPIDINDEKINQVLETIELEDTIKKLPNGIDSCLGKIKEGGVDLSGGEWQRVAIARALASNAPILILDEPTASLDPIIESNVYEMFGRASTGKTTIFITHRLGAAKLADEIIVIADGSVSEKGRHDELIKLNGLYAQMFESQRSWYN